ncbi:MAG: hypothetical protein WBD22_07765 [Pyrinomonadaceae bacterium]
MNSDHLGHKEYGTPHALGGNGVTSANFQHVANRHLLPKELKKSERMRMAGQFTTRSEISPPFRL